MARAVTFSTTGGPEILGVQDVAIPQPGPGQIRVKVRAAGINPVDSKIFTGGPAAAAYGLVLPSGNGSDFAGTVDALGEGVTALAVGDQVYGGLRFSGQADFVVIAAEEVGVIPEGLTMEQAGGLDIVGRTALASVHSVDVHAGDVVFISAAAGGVGVLASQLAVRAGATVVGTASESNHDFLRSLGVTPVAYGDRVVDRLRDAAPGPFTAALDNHGRASIDAALALGIAPERINTIADRSAVPEYGISAVGGAAASNVQRQELAELIAAGEIVLPIDSTFPLEQVRQAYEHAMAGHLRGKVILTLD